MSLNNCQKSGGRAPLGPYTVRHSYPLHVRILDGPPGRTARISGGQLDERDVEGEPSYIIS